jgi:hypothetical protein
MRAEMTKTEISKALKHLENYGWIVKTFNSNRYNMKGSIGFPDHVLVNASKKLLIFIEVKLGKDKLTQAQTNLLTALDSVAEVIVFPFQFGTISELMEYLLNHKPKTK